MGSRDPLPPRRRLVVTTPYACAPPRHGPQVRLAGILTHLGEHWEVVHYTQSIQRTDLPWPPAAVRGGPRWVEHRLRDPVSIAWLVGMSKLGRYPAVYADRLLALAPRRALRAELARADVVLVSPHYQYDWVRRHTLASTRVVVDSSYIEHHVWTARNARWTRLVSREIERSEIAAWRAADAVLATREEEAEIIASFGARRVEVVHNGVDVDRVRPASAAERRAARDALGLRGDAAVAVFVGAAGYGNVHAVDELDRQGAAFARAGVEVHVVGRVGVGRRPAAGVVHHGEVPDVVPWLRAADVALCPLFDEGGTNGTSLKSVEYLAAGLPVVSTPTGMRGLPVRDGVDAVICEHADMVAAATELLGDAARRAALGASARSVAERHLSWQAIGAHATAVLDDLAAARDRELGGDDQAATASLRSSA
jgi:glycosyltransferase involved in cell wall biosynthesis